MKVVNNTQNEPGRSLMLEVNENIVCFENAKNKIDEKAKKYFLVVLYTKKKRTKIIPVKDAADAKDLPSELSPKMEMEIACINPKPAGYVGLRSIYLQSSDGKTLAVTIESKAPQFTSSNFVGVIFFVW